MFKDLISSFNSELNTIFKELDSRSEIIVDFNEIEQSIKSLLDSVAEKLMEGLINLFLRSDEVLSYLKQLGGTMGFKFKEYRKVTLRIYTGAKIKVLSPYFLKTSKKRGRRKRGPNGRGKHVGLEAIGFIGKCSRRFLDMVVKMGLLCPSFSVAEKVLSGMGVEIDEKTISRLCRVLASIGLGNRGKISISGSENLKGKTMVIEIDGGRLRERFKKRGRKKKGQKRQGFNAQWKEPKLFTIHLIDEHGEKDKKFEPIYDATMGNNEAVFEILKAYLHQLNLSDLDKIAFLGDGGPWIWPGVISLCEELDISPDTTHQVMDYTHAKQNLQEVIDLIPNKRGKKKKIIEKQWRDYLWNGRIDMLQSSFKSVFTGEKRKKAISKWKTYFEKNSSRFQYVKFQKENIPCGSGCVESAIRRVINMRLKSAGTFWKPEMAEMMLFLRSQLLSGRWNILMSNVARESKNIPSDIETIILGNDIKVADDYFSQNFPKASNF